MSKENDNINSETGEGNPPVVENQSAAAPQPKIPLTNEQRKAIQKDENNSLKARMLSGEPLPTIKGNKDSKTEIREDEAHLMHLRVMQKQHDPVAKEYKKNERIIKINKLQFQQMELDRAFSIYDGVDIVHDPRSKDEIKAFEELKAKRNKRLNPEAAKK